jgi:hypothetical protein
MAEALASGHVPRAPLLSLFGLLGLLAVGAGQAHALGAELIALLQVPLSGADATEILHGLLRRTAWALGVILAVLVLGSWLAQGPAVVSKRSTFADPGTDRTASVLFALASLVLLTSVVLAAQALELEAGYGWALALVSAACLAIDIAFARARWVASLWMTRREFVDAQRDQGVSPEVAAARRRARA